MLRLVCPSLTHKNLNKNRLWEGCCQQWFVECWCCPLSFSGKDKPQETVPWMIIIGFTRLFSAVLPPHVRSRFFPPPLNSMQILREDVQQMEIYIMISHTLFPLFLMCQERKALLKSVDYLVPWQPWHIDSGWLKRRICDCVFNYFMHL